ncbi:gamma-glutamyltransferase family protein [Falsiroseomonas oryziterrae]|uniref:gamma-glutamyltransferase family protein n=1 Tax=Falsiroseomonas oryziterrae TaxID=2911368 RepID=UPI001F360119|nr:gamma-glutamyltransferase [Roseomonas sp. NPKOSM-4]
MPNPAMIVAPQPEAVEAGADALAAGGSAADALVACALAQGVVDPMMCGLAGLGVLQIHDPASGETTVLDALSTCPAAAREAMWADRFLGECSDGYGYRLEGAANEIGHGAVTTPGILRLLELAHRRWGRLPWHGLFDAAIGHAEEGWTVRPHVHVMFTADEAPYGRLSMTDKLAFTPEGRALYLRGDGTPKRPGDRVVNPAMAATLREVAAGGAEVLHGGALGARIADDMARHGGLLTRDDLAGFRVAEAPPLRVAFQGHVVAVPAPPAGGIVVAEALRILERFDLAVLGHNTPPYIHVVTGAMRVALADREAHIGDPAFHAPPLDRLLSDAHADAAAARIRAGLPAPALREAGEPRDTTTISVLDRDGRLATLTQTLGVPSGVIPPGTGIMLNGAMNWYDPRPGRPGSIAPGKKRFSSMAPTVLFGPDGRALATLGAPGGAWIGVALIQVLLNLVVFRMTMQEAVQAPRFSATTPAIDISNRIPRAVQRELERMGHKVKRSFHSYPFAAPHGIALAGGVPQGGADPQRDGMALRVD